MFVKLNKLDFIKMYLMSLFALHAFSYLESDYIISELFPDSPYDTADKWLLKGSLPFPYRQQIVDFIPQNSGQNNFTFDASFRDPYTGCEY